MRNHVLFTLCLICSFLALTMFLSDTLSSTDLPHDSEFDSSQYDSNVRKLIAGLHEDWNNRDGYIFLVIGKRLFWCLMLDPDAFYSEFASDSIGYQEYLGELDKSVFWNVNDTSIVVQERRRVAAIDRLMEVYVDSSLVKLHSAMLKRLEEIVPSAADRE